MTSTSSIDHGKDHSINVSETPVQESNRDSQTLPPESRETGSRDVIARSSNFLRDWTAAALILSYFVFSISLYTLFTAFALKVFWFLYLSISTVIAGITALEAWDSLTLLKDARNALRKVEQDDWKFATAENVLPNLHLVIKLGSDQLTIVDQVRYILDKVVYPQEKLRITVLYNGAFAISEDLREALSALCAKNPSVHLVQATLEAVASFGQSEVTAIFQEGHYPHPYGPRWAAERLAQDKKVSAVQGRRAVSVQSRSVLSSLISLEHDSIYGVSEPGRSVTWDFGASNGSNVFWRTSVLQDVVGTPDRDIDICYRAVANGLRTVFNMNAIAYERSPSTLRAYWTTRVNGARKGASATANYTKLAFTWPPKARSFKMRFGLLYTLLLDRIGSHVTLQLLCLALGLLFTHAPKTANDLKYLIYFEYGASVWLMASG